MQGSAAPQAQGQRPSERSQLSTPLFRWKAKGSGSRFGGAPGTGDSGCDSGEEELGTWARGPARRPEWQGSPIWAHHSGGPLTGANRGCCESQTAQSLSMAVGGGLRGHHLPVASPRLTPQHLRDLNQAPRPLQDCHKPFLKGPTSAVHGLAFCAAGCSRQCEHCPPSEASACWLQIEDFLDSSPGPAAMQP